MTHNIKAPFPQALEFSHISDTAKWRNGLWKRVLELSCMSEVLHMTFRPEKLTYQFSFMVSAHVKGGQG